jgi:pyruvate kinase
MLNKGPYINQTLNFLCGILTRMQTHQEKRMATLRQLSVCSKKLI